MRKLTLGMKGAALLAGVAFLSTDVFGMRDTEWFNAVKSGNLSEFNSMIASGADISAKDENGNTALIIAAQEGHLEVIKHLIAVCDAGKRGRNCDYVNMLYRRYHTEAYINVKNNKGRTALTVSLWNRHIGVADFLLANGADITVTDKYEFSALSWAENENRIAEQWKEAHGFDDEKNLSEILSEIRSESEDISLLPREEIEKRVDRKLYDRTRKHVFNVLNVSMNIDCETDFQGLALEFAAKNGYAEIVNLLVYAGADVNMPTKDKGPGISVLMLAAMYGHFGIVKLLIGAGADINAKAEYFGTALSIAKEHGFWDIAGLLEEAGAEE